MRRPHPIEASSSLSLSPEVQELVREEVARQVEAAIQAERSARRASNRVTMVVFSGELDKVVASMVIATGAAAMGMKVSMFFTFWGLAALRRGKRLKGKTLRRMMKDQGVASPEELFAAAREAGVRMVACSMSMDLMGISAAELVDGVEVAGVATYLGDAADSRVTLFI